MDVLTSFGISDHTDFHTGRAAHFRNDLLAGEPVRVHLSRRQSMVSRGARRGARVDSSAIRCSKSSPSGAYKLAAVNFETEKLENYYDGETIEARVVSSSSSCRSSLLSLRCDSCDTARKRSRHNSHLLWQYDRIFVRWDANLMHSS